MLPAVILHRYRDGRVWCRVRRGAANQGARFVHGVSLVKGYQFDDFRRLAM